MAIWTLWTQGLRRSSDEFWSLSYREIFSCIDFYIEDRRNQQRSRNMRAGAICATIRNAQRTEDSQKFWKWSDFFPDVSNPQDAPAVKPNRLRGETVIRLRQLAELAAAKRGESQVIN